MFLALRELTFARMRFGLMGAVIALIAVLMVMLSGLSVGLVDDGVSGLQRMPVTDFAFEPGVRQDSVFSRSTVDANAAQVWRAQPGVEDAAPYGNTLVNAESDRGLDIDLALFGVPADSFLSPDVAEGDRLGDPGGIVIGSTAADEGLRIGDTVALPRLDTELTVVGILADQHTFGHVDVAYVPLATWQNIAAGLAPGLPLPAGTADDVTAIAVRTADGAAVDRAAADAAAGTASMSKEDAFDASPGYSAEMSTMLLIRVFLYAISALVVGAFFAIWVIQRRHEIAVMRAMGASAGYVLRDALVQAAVLVVVSVALGVAIGVGLGSLVTGSGMPFSLQAGPIAGASALLVLLGLVGATIAVAKVTSVEPATALGGNR